MTDLPKLALISGGGPLPVEVAAHLARTGRPYLVIRIQDLSDPALDAHPGHTLGLSDVMQLFTILSQEQVKAVCMCGYVKRPDFTTLDANRVGDGLAAIQQASRGGDDKLLRQVAGVIEAQGYVIEGAHEANPDLLIGGGLQSGPQPTSEQMEDAHEAMRVATAIGALDIGQAAVVAGKVTLAVEAQEGTQAMLARVATLPQSQRGTADARKGVLAKVAKPIQDLRLDMPAIGLQTVEDVASAGLAGIIARAGNLLILDKPAVFARASALGIFIHGDHGHP
jgi:DUF1009 family protein